MAIGSAPSLLTYSPMSVRNGGDSSSAGQSTSSSIGQQFTSALNKVNELQQNADTMAEQVASGNVEDAHTAVIAMERAMMALDMTMQVRNKMLEAYQEIMRTQV